MLHTPRSRFARSIALLLVPLGLAACTAEGDDNPDTGVPGADANEVGKDAEPVDGNNPPPDAGGEDAAEPVDMGPQPDGGPGVIATRPTNGSAMMLTTDDAKLLVLNRRTGNGGQATNVNLEKYDVDLANNTMSLRAAADAPGAHHLVIAPDDDTAYVAGATEVWKYTGISGNGMNEVASATPGSEPRGIALSPNGRWLFVANFADGTVTEFDTTNMTVLRTIDLNATLASTGWLGTVAPRPGLAHPYAIAITNDGDADVAEETVYVTEFFSQARNAGVPADDSGFDQGRQGVVYQFNLGTGVVGAPITIAPIADTGFADAAGNVTGCFANQLSAATINNGRLYVTGLCASPRGPVGPVLDANGGLANGANFKTQVHTVIYTIDTTTNTEDPARAVQLTRAFQALYDTAGTPDDGANRRIPLIANDIAFVPGRTVGYVTSYGSDAMFRIQYDADGNLVTVGATTANFIDLLVAGQSPGRLPYGLAITSDGTKSMTVNEFTRNVSFIVFATQNVVATANLADAAPSGLEQEINLGRRFFVTGLGRWSFRGQGWNGCESCHPDGRTDNVTWFFARGPRQTTSLDGSYNHVDGTRRLLNWTAVNDEIHDFELNTRGNSGGVGAIVHNVTPPLAAADRVHFDGSLPVPAGNQATGTPQNGLNGSTISLMPGGDTQPNTLLEDWNDIDAYVRVITAPRSPSGLNPADVAAGQILFENNNCAACHGGTNLWTISRVFYTPSEATNNPGSGSLRLDEYAAPANFPAALNPASSGGGRSAPLRFVNADPAVVAGNDQINCVLRAVGTFPAALDANQTGISPAGVRVREVRQNMSTPAQGAAGFNPPSLLGMGTGAPYFHAGNARTLEELLDDPVFNAHASSLSANYPGAGDRATLIHQLATFVLSIDETTTPIPVPNLGFNPDLCP